MKTHLQMPLGNLAMTRGVNDRFETDEAFALHVKLSFNRYLNHDWGDCCEEDEASNHEATKAGFRIVAAYELDGDETGKIWIITEADRSVTTFLFPSEY